METPFETQHHSHGSHAGHEPVLINIVIDLEDHCINGTPHPDYDDGLIFIYLLRVDDQKYETRQNRLLGSSIIALSGKVADRYLLYQVRRKHGQEYLEPIGESEMVDLTDPGIERFVTKPKMYHFTIGQKRYESPNRRLTVRQILVDYAHVSDPLVHTLADANTQHEYKNLDEVIDLGCVSKFILFNDQPTPVS